MSGLWAFLFGLFYFMYKGIWRHVLIQLVLVVAFFALFGVPGTMFVFVMWVVYAFMAPGIVRANFLRAGYHEGAAPAPPSAPWPPPRPVSDDAYARALAECDSLELRNAGVWARVLAQAGGDEAKAKGAYIAERAPHLAR